MDFLIKHFNDLSSSELYSILKIRFNIFVLEQSCLYPEFDDVDKVCNHVFILNKGGNCIATSRIVPVDVSYKNYSSIGRVCVDIDYRNTKLGRALMEFSIAETKKLYPNIKIKIGAQLYLNAFYKSLGFCNDGVPYNEDEIMHVHMIL